MLPVDILIKTPFTISLVIIITGGMISIMVDTLALPQPIFDTLESLELDHAILPSYVLDDDVDITRQFLLAYRGSPDTFNSYRREVDRFLQWVYLVAQMPLMRISAIVTTHYGHRERFAH